MLLLFFSTTYNHYAMTKNVSSWQFLLHLVSYFKKMIAKLSFLPKKKNTFSQKLV